MSVWLSHILNKEFNQEKPKKFQDFSFLKKGTTFISIFLSSNLYCSLFLVGWLLFLWVYNWCMLGFNLFSLFLIWRVCYLSGNFWDSSVDVLDIILILNFLCEDFCCLTFRRWMFLKCKILNISWYISFVWQDTLDISWVLCGNKKFSSVNWCIEIPDGLHSNGCPFIVNLQLGKKMGFLI